MTQTRIAMKYSVFIFLALAVACSSATPVPDSPPDTSQTQKAQVDETQSEPREFDARLSNFEYPYDVEIFEVEAGSETLEMAYMDVRPEESNGKTVLLLHGKNFSGAYWANTIAPLVESGYRVIAPDQIGFGKSSKPTDYPFSFHVLAKHTKALIDTLDAGPVAVVGHSMGGMVATRFALMFPEQTTGLVLVNPIGLEDWKREGVPYLSVDQWHEAELQKTPEKVKAYMTESYFDGVWKPEYQPLVELQAGWTQDPDYPRIARVSALTFDMIYTQPVVYEFGLVDTPTLLIIGDRDRTALGKALVSEEIRSQLGLYGELGERAAKAFPDATLVKLEGVGHIPQYEAFDAYFQALSDFLEN